MCDILIATPKTTENGEMIFAKNSDRDPNEAQVLEFYPRQTHDDITTKLTYISFLQSHETYSIIISRPWWIWGAEMGANEFGLVIGNTAVFTKEPYNKIGILGMDLVRLALERTKKAHEALMFITSTIEKYGQGGNGSYEHKLLYHNSFIIADPKDAYVLETAGKFWVAKKINGVYTISNALTIEKDWDYASNNIIEHAIEKGWCKNKDDFSFSKCYSDKFYTHFAHGKERRLFTYQKLKEKEGQINLEYMMHLLRSHHKEPFKPSKGSMKDICMHYGGLTRPSQTASSQISVLTKDDQTHWFTGTSNPCLSIFKPFKFESNSIEQLKLISEKNRNISNKYNENTYWWSFEKFHRIFHTNYQKYIKSFIKDRDEIQQKIIKETIEPTKKEPNELTKWTYEKELELLEKWSKQIKPNRIITLYNIIWKITSNKAHMKL